MEPGQFLSRQSVKLMGIGFGAAVFIISAGAFTYAYADDPAFCGSCHAMESQYATWQASSHKSVKCSDCHLPHDQPEKLIAKAQTGMVDVYHQVLRDYPLQIETTEKGKEYLQQNCLRCHESTVSNVSMGSDCTTCHRELVHS